MQKLFSILRQFRALNATNTYALLAIKALADANDIIENAFIAGASSISLGAILQGFEISWQVNNYSRKSLDAHNHVKQKTADTIRAMGVENSVQAHDWAAALLSVSEAFNAKVEINLVKHTKENFGSSQNFVFNSTTKVAGLCFWNEVTAEQKAINNGKELVENDLNTIQFMLETAGSDPSVRLLIGENEPVVQHNHELCKLLDSELKTISMMFFKISIFLGIKYISEENLRAIEGFDNNPSVFSSPKIC